MFNSQEMPAGVIWPRDWLKVYSKPYGEAKCLSEISASDHVLGAELLSHG